MLGWVACALAARCFPTLDLGLVAQFALIHDAPEVYAGDTPTLRIDAHGQAAKADRERAATRQLWSEYGDRLPWFPSLISLYEKQELPEARLVRGLDKILPKIVHVIDGATGLREHGVTAAELADILQRQHTDMQQYVGEFTALMALHAEMAARATALLRATENASKGEEQ